VNITSKVLASALLVLPVTLCAAQEKLQPLHAPDGGTIERFASISIPATPDAPFTATVNAEWIRQVPDGSLITLKNHRIIARDAKGRIYQQRAFFVPDDGKQESAVYQIEISDPAARERYVCRPAERICRLQRFVGSEFEPGSGTTAAGLGSPGSTVEHLGTQTVSGLETVGTRETHLLAAATMGNEAPILERKEFWYSPQLGINLVTKREDASHSTQQNFAVTDISLGDPDPSRFAPPAGYKVLDLRNPPEVSATRASSPN